jgi:hypothetical protein
LAAKPSIVVGVRREKESQMPRHPVWIEGGQKAPGQPDTKPSLAEQPPPVEDFGGGDITSLEEQPLTDDRKALD